MFPRCKGIYGATYSYSFTANQRFVTFYGQKTAQLDRLQEMFAVDGVQHKWLLKLANTLMWGIPLHYINLLDDLYVNEQVYADQWTRFLDLCLADWTTSLSWVRWHVEHGVDILNV